MKSSTGMHGGRLWKPVLGISLVQLSLGMLRPAISYQAIAFGGDAMEIGMIAAAYAILPMFIAISVGALAGRLRRIAVVPVMMTAIVVLGSVVSIASTSVWWLTLASALIGVGNIGVIIGAQTWITRSANAMKYDSAFGLMTAAMSLAQGLGPVVGGVLIGGTAQEAMTAEGLRVTFWVSLGFAVIALFCFLSRGKREYQHSAKTDKISSVGGVLRLPRVAQYMFASAAVLTTVDILGVYLPAIGEKHGIAPSVIGLLLGIRGITSMVSRLFLSAMTKRWSRVALTACATLGSGVAIAAIAVTSWLPVLVLAMVIGGFLLGIVQPVTISSIAQAVPERSRSDALAIRLLGNRVAQAILPLVAGGLGTAVGLAAIFWLQAAFLIASAGWLVAGPKSSGTQDLPHSDS